MTKRSEIRQKDYQAGKITFKEYVHDLYEEFYGTDGIEQTKSAISVPPTKMVN